MSKEDFLKGMKYLSSAYNKELDATTVSVWFDAFKEIDLEIFKKIAKKIVLTEEFMPSVAKFNKYLNEEGNPALKLNASEEWEKVIYAIRRNGLRNTYFEPITQRCINTIGVERLEQMESDKVQWFEKRFIEIFNNKKIVFEDKIIDVSISRLLQNNTKRIGERK